MMQKISLGISVVALIVSGAVFFTRPTAATHAAAGDVSPAPDAAAFANPDSVRTPVVAYINGDSIMANYTAFKEMESQLKASLNSSSSRVQSEIEKANREAQELENSVSTMGDKLTDADLRAAQERMMELEYQIQQLKNQEQDKLLQEEAKLNEAIMKKIREYLGRYCAQHGIDMVYNYMELNQSLLYGSEAFDITGSVIQGLNAEHAASK